MAKLGRGLESNRRRSIEIFERLKEDYPDARCSLNFRNPLELLVATILAAQCTDERVNLVTRGLFRKYKRPQDYVNAPREELEEDVRTCGFFRQKSKGIVNACSRILDVYPHLVVMKRFEPFTDYRDVEARLRTDPAVAGASHVTYDEMMISAGGRNRGVRVKGVAVAASMYREVLAPFLHGGTLDDLEETPRAEVDAGGVRVSGLVQGGVYHLVLYEREGALAADLFDAESTSPGPAAGDLAATTAEGGSTDLPPERGVDLDRGAYTVVGAYTRGDLTCRPGERVLLWADPGRGVSALPQPRW